MRSELAIAEREFKDYLTSMRFLLIFAVLVLMTVAAVISGVSTYDSQIASYNQDLQQASQSVKSISLQMPSMMLVFGSFGATFATVGWLLAIAIGFDLISKEKESGSLKLLLARPIFRDSIINGKILGSMGTLLVALAGTFLIALAILLLKGITPAGDDLARLVAFFVAIVLFCVTFLAIGIAASAIARNSTMAILLAIGVVVFSLLLPSFASSICAVALGPAPQIFLPQTSNATDKSPGSSSIVFGTSNGTSTSMIQMQLNPAYIEYQKMESMITGTISLISPTSDLNDIVSVVTGGQSAISAGNSVSGQFVYTSVGMSAPTLGSTIFTVLPQMLALLVISIAGFAIAYAKFIRMDVR
jgi:ABC-2 type transport system permease protein